MPILSPCSFDPERRRLLVRGLSLAGFGLLPDAGPAHGAGRRDPDREERYEPPTVPPEPPSRTPKPSTRGRRPLRETIYIDRSGTYDFHDVLHVWKGQRWARDREYGPPALHVRASNVVILNFACSGAPDGIHVGGLAWSAANAVRKHPAVRNVRFHRLQVLDIREDAFTCQKETRDVVIEQSHFWGGRDKAIQNDHCVGLSIRSCGFYDGARSIRWKAGTSGTVSGCLFLDCPYPIKADGMAWPEDPGRGRRRPAARTSVDITHNTFVNARIAIDADSGSRIREGSNRFIDVDKKTLVRPGARLKEIS